MSVVLNNPALLAALLTGLVLLCVFLTWQCCSGLAKRQTQRLQLELAEERYRLEETQTKLNRLTRKHELLLENKDKQATRTASEQHPLQERREGARRKSEREAARLAEQLTRKVQDNTESAVDGATEDIFFKDIEAQANGAAGQQASQEVQSYFSDGKQSILDKTRFAEHQQVIIKLIEKYQQQQTQLELLQSEKIIWENSQADNIVADNLAKGQRLAQPDTTGASQHREHLAKIRSLTLHLNKMTTLQNGYKQKTVALANQLKTSNVKNEQLTERLSSTINELDRVSNEQMRKRSDESHKSDTNQLALTKALNTLLVEKKRNQTFLKTIELLQRKLKKSEGTVQSLEHKLALEQKLARQQSAQSSAEAESANVASATAGKPQALSKLQEQLAKLLKKTARLQAENRALAQQKSQTDSLHLENQRLAHTNTELKSRLNAARSMQIQLGKAPSNKKNRKNTGVKLKLHDFSNKDSNAGPSD